MATTKEYKDFVLEQLNNLEDITYKPMMGEYLLYYKGVLFGGIYDDRFLIKIVEQNKKYKMSKEIPYEHAKPMYLIKDIENKEQLREIILDTYKDLSDKKEKNNTVLERIRKNEERLESIKKTIQETNQVLQDLKKKKKDIFLLQKYYGSKTWFQDKEAYEQNRISKIKAGVLSEDEVWNTLEYLDDLLQEMKKILTNYKK